MIHANSLATRWQCLQCNHFKDWRLFILLPNGLLLHRLNIHAIKCNFSTIFSSTFKKTYIITNLGIFQIFLYVDIFTKCQSKKKLFKGETEEMSQTSFISVIRFVWANTLSLSLSQPQVFLHPVLSVCKPQVSNCFYGILLSHNGVWGTIVYT